MSVFLETITIGWLGFFVLEPFVAIPWIANILYFGNLIFNKYL